MRKIRQTRRRVGAVRVEISKWRIFITVSSGEIADLRPVSAKITIDQVGYGRA